jgi:hypothetical protein
MSTSRAVVLFIVGLLLALLAFPTAFWISAALGYVFGIIALVIGALLVVKRAGRALPLALGIVLVVIAVIFIGVTAFIHMAAYTVEEVTKPKQATGTLGQPISVGGWEVTVLGVREAKYLKKGDVYYSAKEGQKAVIVSLRVKNVGKDVKSASDLWSFTLTTNAGKSYDFTSIANFDVVWSWSVTEEVRTKAVSVSDLNLFQSIAPGTYVEGDMLFSVPQNETPIKLFFKVGIVGPTVVEVSLSKT